MGGVRVRRLTALVWARVGYAAGVVVAAVGIGVEAGPGWGMAVGGAVGAASCLLLVDVDDRRPRKGGGSS